MITAEFRKSGDKLIGFKVGGHSGYAESGQDIICAAVSSAVELAECIINDTMYADAKVSVNNKTAEVSLKIKEDDTNARAVVEGLKIYLTYLSEQYPENIRVREV